MNMDEAAADPIKAKKAQYGWMIAICHRGKELEALGQQNHFGAVLILSFYEQVEIGLASQCRMDSSAALPVAIGNVVPEKFRKGGLQHR